MLLSAAGVMLVVSACFLGAGRWAEKTGKGFDQYLYLTGGFALTTAVLFAAWSLLMALL